METLGNSWLLQKRNLYWICQFGGWGAYLVLAILGLYTEERFDWRSGLDTLLTVSALMLITHFFRKYITKREWLKMLFGRLFPHILLASLVLSAIALPCQLLFSFLLNNYYSLDLTTLLRSLIEGGFMFFIWQIAYFLYHYVNNYNRNLKLEAMVNEFELNKLKSQLNPHFIFNALNSVKALVDEDPERAKDSIYQLSSILRSSLMMDKKKVIPMEEELDIVKNYLALEGTRFEERLKVAYHVAPEALRFLVPPMMLQTLVENGIKHGISNYKDGGTISLSAQVEQGNLRIQIRNTGQLGGQKQPGTGYGLRSTTQRLNLLYDKGASFSVANENSDTVLTELVIPPWNPKEVVFYA
jgi:sensor histidine kinase YesM